MKTEEEVIYMNPAELKSSKYKFTRMDSKEYEQLKTSISISGFSKHLPIKVRKMTDGSLEIINGHHRRDVALELKLKEVPIRVCNYSNESEVISDAIQSNKDMGSINYFEVSRSWESVFGPYEKGKHGETSQEEIGTHGGGFSRELVTLIRPIYGKLNCLHVNISDFSNHDLIQIARVEDDRFRKELIEYSDKLSSDELQERATICNKISKYIVKKLKNVESHKEILKEVYEAILNKNLLFKDSFESLQVLIDEIIDKPIRYNPNYILGNSLEAIQDIPSESIHLVVTSPPYGSLKDYKTKGQITSLTGYTRYLSEMETVWENCFRVLAPGGRLVVVIGDEVVSSGTNSAHRVKPIHADIITQCVGIGYFFMSNIIWKKVNVARPSGGGAFPGSYPYPRECLLNQDHEYLLVFRKPGDTSPDSLVIKESSKMEKEEWSEYISSIWNIPGEKKTNHPAPFPDKISSRLVKMFSFKKETVLDPFVGSGTTCISAMKLGRKSIGIEINKKYIEIAEKLTKEIIGNEKEYRYIEGEGD